MELKKLKKIIQIWQKDPIRFFKDCWPNIYLWDKLEEIIKKTVTERRIAVNSAHGIGKSFISARLALWFLITHIPSKVITTAPKWEQVRSILWAEIKTAITQSQILQDLIPRENILETEIKIAPNWFMKGEATKENVEFREYGSTKMQGYHSPNLLIIMDEAPGVEESIHLAVENLAVGKNNKILKIGNPTSPVGSFYKNCQNWANIHISAFDHPNIKQDREVIPGCITRQWVEERQQEWGENSSLYVAKVLGLFPQEGEDTIIPLNWILEAVDYNPTPSLFNLLGFDPARFGDDETVFYQLKNNEVNLKGVYRKQDTMETTGRIVRWAEQERFDVITGDPIGIGAGIFDRVKELNNSYEYRQAGKTINLQEVNFALKSLDPRYLNLRAEAYGFLADKLNPANEGRVKIPDDVKLHGQLASLRYKFNSNGKLYLEAKEEMKRRGLSSPDRADALAIVIYGLKYLERPKRLIEYQSMEDKEFYKYKKSKLVTLTKRLNKL